SAGKSVANFSLAINQLYRNKQDTNQRVEWVRCVARGRLAQITEKLVAKGAVIFVEGRLQTRKFGDREGGTKTVTGVVVASLRVLGCAKTSNHAGNGEHNSRIAAGGLNNPIIYDRYANGFEVSDLITDFGRTHDLVKSSNLHAQAQQERVVTSRADVLVNVDRAYFDVLRNQTVLRVAEQTVNQRKLVADLVDAEAKHKLKSGLDVSFAQVDLSQAQLLLIQGQNNLQASYAQLSDALGYADQQTFDLAEEPMPSQPPGDLSQLVQQALKDRPEMISQRLDVGSAETYATAERDLWFPTISVAGATGLTPFRQDQLAARYAAAGFTVNIPIFNGHLFGALRGEANARARVQEQYMRELQDAIVRDVRTAWLNANSSYQRLSVTNQLLAQPQQSLHLLQARYKLGLSSIVELSQAQLNETSAEIAQASAKYDYQIQVSILNYQIGALH
ncbi:MAG: single-stranded DNA-binding protein, partial [Candidatus Acidiferrales bacterium]